MSHTPLRSLSLVPTLLPTSSWWTQAPIAAVLIEWLQPCCVAVLGSNSDVISRHLQEVATQLSPQTTVLDIPRPKRIAPPAEGVDLLLIEASEGGSGLPSGSTAWIDVLRSRGVLLVTPAAAACELERQHGDHCLRFEQGDALLLWHRQEAPVWRDRLEALRPLLEEKGHQLSQLSRWITGRELHRQLHRQRNTNTLLEEHLQATLEKLDALENSTFWRATAPLRRLLDSPRGRQRQGEGGGHRQQERQARGLARRLLPSKPLPQQRGKQTIDPARSGVLLITHETSPTGAPILAWNLCQHLSATHNVVVLAMNVGALKSDFLDQCAVLVGPPGPEETPSLGVITECLNQLPAGLSISFAIVNTIQCWRWPELLRRCDIPCLSLIHEFAAYVRPQEAFTNTCLWSAKTIFSTSVTWKDMLRHHSQLGQVPVALLPQGACTIPPSLGDDSALVPRSLEEIPELQAAHPSAWLQECLLILGAGAVQPRKGVDLFVECANRLQQRLPDAPLLFVWLGSGFDPGRDFTTSIWVDDQIRRSDLGDCLHILSAPDAYTALMRRADLFLLTSRLDPLPNVAIDAMGAGTPVLCFDRASGTAEWLSRDPLLQQHCLARYLDPSAMAEKASALLRDETLRRQIGTLSHQLARTEFNMEAYVASLRALGSESRRQLENEASDLSLLLEGCWVDTDFCTPATDENEKESVLRYLMSWRNHVRPRKPFPGFHPGVYAEHRMASSEMGDPLAHYLRSGQPAGPWRVPVIRPGSHPLPPAPVASPPRVALHLHVFYPDLLEEILERISFNRIRPTLMVSLTDPGSADVVWALLQRYGHRDAVVRLTPNRGRDIGPLLVDFGGPIEQEFDIHGHLHTKKSELIDADNARRWRAFLLDNLLGTAETPMADRVIQTLWDDPQLGLVFPDDPNCMDWGANRDHAEKLAERINIGVEFPDSIDFPIGTMFWARRGALRPLYDHTWTYEDFPEEPLSYDGTVLHAIERLLPLICHHCGFRHHVTHVPSVTRPL